MILKNAYSQQIIDQDDNGWVVYNGDERVTVLPQPCNEHTAMAAIRMGRKAELSAFAKGSVEGKKLADILHNSKMLQIKARVLELESMNERLAEKLEKLIIGEDE